MKHLILLYTIITAVLAQNTLIIIGGGSGELGTVDDGGANKVELVNLVTKNVCPLNNIDQVATGAVGAFITGKPVICGGSPATNMCYQHNVTEDSWTPWLNSQGQALTLSSPRSNAASIQFNPQEWFITGGFDNDTQAGSTISEWFREENDGFVQRANMLDENRYHNLVRLDDNTAWQVGGYFSKNTTDAYLYDKVADSWSIVPSTPWPVNHGQAGTAIFPDTSPNAGFRTVIAGGTGEFRVEIFNPATGIWLPAVNDMPFDIRYGTSVDYNESFLILGGRSRNNPAGGENTIPTIFWFNPANELFEEFATMSIGRETTTAFLIPDDYAPC